MKYFTLEEFFRSETAKANKIDNTTKDKNIIHNIENLVEKLLDPLREEYGKPITISSGYRCQKLNSILPGASQTSDHKTGQSADLVVKDGSKGLKVLAGIVFRNNWMFDQMIWEHDGAWLHISLRRTSVNRSSVLKTVKGGYERLSAEFIQECIDIANKECPIPEDKAEFIHKCRLM